ncbi:MAG: glycosyltransferase family 1 protein [Muribaculaceae bacterium]|nr:glycosyltransferase family 1 protein [Muribaculaceae bacterium]
MKRVLQVLNTIDRFGIATFLMNVYRNIDRDKVRFDFLVSRMPQSDLADELKEMGSEIFTFFPRGRNPKRHLQSLHDFFSKHASRYDAVHYHSNSFTNISFIEVAKKYGIPVRIYHSHSISTRGWYHRLFHRLNRRRLMQSGTHFLACSSAAMDWGYKKGSEAYSAARIIRNGIELARYRFNPEIRADFRRRHGLEDRFVVGHMGNFLPVKNYPFLLQVFKRLKERVPEAALLLVGDGDTSGRADTEALAKELGIADSVVFTGLLTDVVPALQAMDVYLFPSIFEGLPMSVVEAQAAGLHVVASEAIPEEAGTPETLTRLSLELPADEWVERIMACKDRQGERAVPDRLSVYDIAATCESLMKIYCEPASFSR